MLIIFVLIALFVISMLSARYLQKYECSDTIIIIYFLYTCLLASLIILCSAQIYRENALAEFSFIQKSHEKYMICYEIARYPESESAQYKKDKFNTELEVYKRMAESPWTNWFCNKQIAAMDYIELEE